MNEVNFLLRNKNKFATIVIVLLFTVIALFTIVKYAVNGKGSLANPGLQKANTQFVPQPSTPPYNPPKEIKYDSSTDLKQELENINPQVNDSDF